MTCGAPSRDFVARCNKLPGGPVACSHTLLNPMVVWKINGEVIRHLYELSCVHPAWYSALFPGGGGGWTQSYCNPPPNYVKNSGVGVRVRPNM